MTDRDMQIVNFVNEVNIATTQQIIDIFFRGVSKTVASRRLNYLVDYGHLKRVRSQEFNNAFIYYTTRKPKNLVHEIIGTQLYAELVKLDYTVLRFIRNKSIGPCIPDVILLVADTEGNEKLYFVEVQRNFNQITKCTDKYKELYYSNDWKKLDDKFPTVLVISDIKYHPRYQEFEVLKTNTKYEKLDKIINLT